MMVDSDVVQTCSVCHLESKMSLTKAVLDLF